MKLRNEIIPVKELKKRFSTAVPIKMLQLSTPSNHTIEKTLVLKIGFLKVTGMQITDVKNNRFDASRVGQVNPISGCKYSETEYTTEAKWIFQ